MYCGQCDKIDDALYGDWPYQVKCPYNGELRWRGEEWFDYGRMKPMRTDYCPGCGAKMDLEDVYGY